MHFALYFQENGSLYVCGDAKHMAKDVHKALLNIIQNCGGFCENQAEKYLKDLESQDRYQKDVWVT